MILTFFLNLWLLPLGIVYKAQTVQLFLNISLCPTLSPILAKIARQTVESVSLSQNFKYQDHSFVDSALSVFSSSMITKSTLCAFNGIFFLKSPFFSPLNPNTCLDCVENPDTF